MFLEFANEQFARAAMTQLARLGWEITFHATMPEATPVNVASDAPDFGNIVSANLSDKEASLLSELVALDGKAGSRSKLLQAVWNEDNPNSRALDVTVARLRKKLAQGVKLVTVRGVGYRLDK